MAAVDEPEADRGRVAEEPAVAEDDAAAELVAAEPPVDDDAPALEIVPVHELDQPGTDDGALEVCRSADTTEHAWHTEDATHEPAAFEPDLRARGRRGRRRDRGCRSTRRLLPAAVAAEAVTDADALPDLP